MKLKASVTILAFLALQFSVLAQIIYEESIDEKTHSILLDKGELKYAAYDKVEKAINLYHSDDSHWKSIPLNLSRGLYFDELKSVSVNVFNEDNLIELAYTCVEYKTSNELEATSTYVDVLSTLYVVNEEGTLVLEAKNGNDMKIIDSNGEMKLWVYKHGGQSKDNKTHIDVYSLPNYHTTNTKNPDGLPPRYGNVVHRSGI